MRDWAYFKAGIRDLSVKRRRDRIEIVKGTRELAILRVGIRENKSTKLYKENQVVEF